MSKLKIFRSAANSNPHLPDAFFKNWHVYFSGDYSEYKTELEEYFDFSFENLSSLSKSKFFNVFIKYINFIEDDQLSADQIEVLRSLIESFLRQKYKTSELTFKTFDDFSNAKSSIVRDVCSEYSSEIVESLNSVSDYESEDDDFFKKSTNFLSYLPINKRNEFIRELIRRNLNDLISKAKINQRLFFEIQIEEYLDGNRDVVYFAPNNNPFDNENLFEVKNVEEHFSDLTVLLPEFEKQQFKIQLDKLLYWQEEEPLQNQIIKCSQTIFSEMVEEGFDSFMEFEPEIISQEMLILDCIESDIAGKFAFKRVSKKFVEESRYANFLKFLDKYKDNHIHMILDNLNFDNLNSFASWLYSKKCHESIDEFISNGAKLVFSYLDLKRGVQAYEVDYLPQLAFVLAQLKEVNEELFINKINTIDFIIEDFEMKPKEKSDIRFNFSRELIFLDDYAFGIYMKKHMGKEMLSIAEFLDYDTPEMILLSFDFKTFFRDYYLS